MDPKFVNRFTRSHEVERELYHYLYVGSPGNIVCFVLLALAGVSNLVMMLIAGIVFANLAVLVMVILLVFIMLYRYFAALRISRKRLEESTNGAGELGVTETLTSEELISESSNRDKPIVVPYAQLKRVFVTKNYYMVQTDAKMVYAFKKGAFTVGREEDFIPYVRQILDHNKRKAQ